MFAYIVRRLLLMVPTLFGIMIINFVVIQAAPGGPVEQTLARLQGNGVDATSRVSGIGAGEVGGAAGGAVGTTPGSSGAAPRGNYVGAEGLDPALIARLEKLYGFDKPPLERFTEMIGRYVRFDFGESFYRDRSVMGLVLDKLPVSISLGLWSTLIIYLISIPLGVAKAVRDGSRFDLWTSSVIIVGNAIPSLLFAVLLIVLVCRGQLPRPLSAARPHLGQLCRTEYVGQNRGLFLASGAADFFARYRRFCRIDAPDQKLVFRRNHQTVCGYGKGQGLTRTARAVRARIS